jgi:hypothetical protein
MQEIFAIVINNFISTISFNKLDNKAKTKNPHIQIKSLFIFILNNHTIVLVGVYAPKLSAQPFDVSATSTGQR